MEDNFLNFVTNKTVLTSLAAWLIAQVLKVLVELFQHKKLDLKRLVDSGGMPSSHSAIVMALFMAVGFEKGFETPECAIAFILACVVMYDASGVRRAAGEQAKVLNEMIEMLHQKKNVTGAKLKELLGHTPIQVISGAILGVVVAIFSHYLL